MGFFDVHMPLIYGEGEEKAFRRLREEIEKPFTADRMEQFRLGTLFPV